jgi:hypothetical protein
MRPVARAPAGLAGADAGLRRRHVLLNHQHWNYLCDWLGLT